MSANENRHFPYHSEPIRGALLLGLVLAIIGLILWVVLPLLILRLFAASFAVGPLAWAALQVLRSRHGVTLGADHVRIQHPVIGVSRRIPYAHLQGIELLTDELAIAYAKPVIVDPTYRPQSLTEARPKQEQRRLVLVKDIDQLDQLAEELCRVAADKGAALAISRDVMQTWAKRIKVRRVVFVILGVLSSPLVIIFIFRTISDIIG